MIEFKGLNWFHTKGRGWVVTVECDKERPRSDAGLIGEVVSVDGEPFEVLGVDRFALQQPIAAGEKIGLLVREPQ